MRTNALPHSLESVCAERGISSAVADDLRWRVKGHHLLMPVYDLDGNLRQIRRKNLRYATHKHEAKYDTLKGEGIPQDVSYKFYHAPNLRQAVASANGRLLIANGEPAAAAMLSAGIANVCSIGFGEGNIPANLIPWLTDLGVTHVMYCPDRDDTGRKSATSLRNVLAHNGIEFDCRQLPDTLADKADLNDLWQAVAFNADVFAAELLNLPPFTAWHAQPATPRQSKPSQIYTGSGGLGRYEEYTAEVRQAVESRQDSVRRGRYTYYRCPVHQDNHPSFRISERGVPQCSCGIQHQSRPWEVVATSMSMPDYATWRNERYPLPTRSAGNSRNRPEAANGAAPEYSRPAPGEDTPQACATETAVTTRFKPYTQEEVEHERAYVEPILAAAAQPVAGTEPIAAPEATWILTPWQVIGIRKMLGCNAVTADAFRDLLEFQAAGRLAQSFTVVDVAVPLGYNEQFVRRTLDQIEEFFSLAAQSEVEPLCAQTEKKSRRKRGRPPKRYRLPDRDSFEAMVAPYADAAMVQTYCPVPGLVPMTEERARRMYVNDVAAEQLDPLAARAVAACTRNPRAEAAARHRLKRAEREAGQYQGAYAPADSNDPEERQRQRDTKVFELANEEPKGVRELAAWLNCSVAKVKVRALNAGYVPHPTEDWVDVTGPGAWLQAKQAAAGRGGKLLEVEFGDGRRKYDVREQDLRLAPGETARVFIRGKNRYIYDPIAARLVLNALDTPHTQPVASVPTKAKDTPCMPRTSNRYGWTWETRLHNLEIRTPNIAADGSERSPFLEIEDAAAALLAVPLEVLKPDRPTITCQGIVEDETARFDAAMPASCAEPSAWLPDDPLLNEPSPTVQETPAKPVRQLAVPMPATSPWRRGNIPGYDPFPLLKDLTGMY